MKSLLSLYIDGQRAAEDFAQGAQWFQKAADQGSPDAQFGLGLLYAAGQGIGQSYPDAYYWLYLAATPAAPVQAKAATARDDAASHLTPDQLQSAKQRADQWLSDHPPKT